MASSMTYNPLLNIVSQSSKARVDDCNNRAIAFSHPLNRVNRLTESLSNLLHLHVETPLKTNKNILHSSKFWHHEEKTSTSPKSPKEIISSKWREIHGSDDWDNLLNPLHPWLRREIIKYGEFAQATYDAFDFNSFSEYCGSCRYNKGKLFNELGLSQNGYRVTEYIHAMSHLEMPSWLERSHVPNTWSKDSNWIGFVAVSDDMETARIGRRDIVVTWRGTVAPSEWYDNLQRNLEPIGHGGSCVEHGFLSIYTSKKDSTRYNKSSASEQAMGEISRLVNLYLDRGEEVSLTITGHSLGGALALLNAHEAAHVLPSGVHISVVSFAGPRVGNIAFRDELRALGVKTLRVVLDQDIVPRLPGFILNESVEKFEDITGTLEWVYTHVGTELRLNSKLSPYLKGGFNPIGYHSVETYLHLVDGFRSKELGFREEARRDVALVNKASNLLIDELRIPPCWYQMENKGLVRNKHGRWVKPKREPEDIPSPTTQLGAGEQYEMSFSVLPIQEKMASYLPLYSLG